MYDKVAADLIEALDVASAYRATASTLHREMKRRNGVKSAENRGIYLNRETTSNSLPRTHRIQGQARVVATLRIFVWTLFFATIGFILFAPMSVRRPRGRANPRFDRGRDPGPGRDRRHLSTKRGVMSETASSSERSAAPSRGAPGISRVSGWDSRASPAIARRFQIGTSD